MLEALQKSITAIDKEFSLASVEVLRPHELRAKSEEHSFIINGKATHSYTMLPVESGVYPVSAICGTSYDPETMKITTLSPLDAYGLESIKKAIVTKKVEA